MDLTHARSSSSSEDETTEVGSALVAQSTGSVDESADTVRLHGRADERGSPGGADGSGLLGLEELLLRVGLLRLAVGLAKDGAEDGEGGGVVEDGAERDGRGLDGWEIWWEG